MLRHEDYKEMLAAHALNALEAAEARELDAHLATCEECRRELDGWHETASALAFAAETQEPSASLRSSILEKARERKSLETVTNESVEKSSNLIPFNAQPRLARSSIQTFTAIAASLIIAALAAAVVILWQRSNRMEAEMARISRDYNESQIELARAREDSRILTAPGASVAVLGGTEKATGASAHLAYDKTTGRAMLVADGLPPAPEGKAYQLWFIADGKPLPGGVFNTDAKGHVEMRDQIPPAGRASASFAVTMERAGGVPAPEGQAYLKSQI